MSITLTYIILIDMDDLIATKLIPWIDSRRRQAGLTQSALAVKLGCTQARISQLLAGESSISLAQYARLADVVGFDAAKGLQLLHPERRDDGRAC